MRAPAAAAVALAVSDVVLNDVVRLTATFQSPVALLTPAALLA